MSRFSQYEQLAPAAVDSLYGERTRIEPQRKGDVFAGGVDGSRPPIDVIGIPDFNPIMVTTKEEHTYDGYQPQLAGDRMHVSYATSSFPSAAQFPKQGDLIALVERPGIPKFKLTREPDHDGIGRMVCVCVPA